MAKKKEIDWEKGEKLFRLGQLSAAEIGRRLGCPTSTVTRHMTAAGITQDRAEEVRRRTREAIATQRNEAATQRNDEGGEKPPVIAPVTEDDINEAVNTNIALVNSHRRDLSKLQAIEAKLLGELEGTPTKLYITQYQGEIVEKTVGLTVTEKAAALQSLTQTMAKRIEKQRQAFSIDDAAPSDKDPVDEILEAVAQRRVSLVREPVGDEQD